MIKLEIVPCNQVPVGKLVKIRWIEGDKDSITQLQEFGLIEGRRVWVERKVGKSVVILMDNTRIFLNFGAGTSIMVEIIS